MIYFAACGAGGALYTLICCVVCCPCFYSCFYRSKMRQQYTLEKSPCGDCLVHCCCESCALCQEYRELESRGYDMKIGKTTNHNVVLFIIIIIIIIIRLNTAASPIY